MLQGEYSVFYTKLSASILLLPQNFTKYNNSVRLFSYEIAFYVVYNIFHGRMSTYIFSSYLKRRAKQTVRYFSLDFIYEN